MSDFWRTPEWIIENLMSEFGYEYVDLCAKTCTAPMATDGVLDIFALDTIHANIELISGYGWAFMNPPYSRGNIYKFLKKAIDIQSKTGKPVVALIKVGTSTKYWDLIWDYKNNKPKSGVEIRYFPKRVQFVPPDSETKVSSSSIETCLVIIRTCVQELQTFNPVGKCYHSSGSECDVCGVRY